MATLRELLVKVGVKVDDKQLQSLDKGLQQVKSSAMLLGGALVGIGATLLGVTKSAADYADQIDDTSMRLGVARGELQKLQYAMQLSGGDAKLLTIGLTRLTDRVKLLQQGSKDAIAVYQEMGITVEKQDGSLKSSNELLLDLADVFSKMPDGIQKTQMAMRAIGPEAGPKLIPMLNAGRKGIEAMGKEAEDLGLILDDASIKAGSDFNDALDGLLGSFSGLKNAIGAQLFPVMTEFIGSIKQFMLANREVIKQNLTSFVEGLVTTVRVAKTVFFGMANTVQFLAGYLGGLVPILKTLGALFLLYQGGKLVTGLFNIAKGFGAVAKAIRMANISALLIPILIGAAVAAVYLIIDDVYNFIQGKPSFLGYLIANKDQILNNIKEFLANTLAAILGFFGMSEERTASFVKFFSDSFDAVIKGVGVAYEWLGELFDSVVKMIVGIVNGELTTVWEGYKDLLSTIYKPFIAAAEMAFDYVYDKLVSVGQSIKEYFTGLLNDTIGKVASVADKVTGFLGIDGLIGDITAMVKGPESFEGTAQSLAASPSFSSVSNNQSMASNTNVSPTINITMGGGSSGAPFNPEDLAQTIGREITRVAQTVSKNNEPIFSD